MGTCPICHTFLERCPCCGVSFCPDCRSIEDEDVEETFTDNVTDFDEKG